MSIKKEKDADNRSTVGGPSRIEGVSAVDFTAKLTATNEACRCHAL